MSTIKVDTIQTRNGSGSVSLSNHLDLTTGGLSVTGALPSLTVDKGGIDRSGNTTRIVSGRAGGNYADFSVVIAGVGGVNRQLHIDYQGNTTLDNGNLIMGTSGKGIDFSATSDASGKTSELLDDYEEGTFTPAAGDYSGTMTFTTAYYTKVGRMVNFAFKMTGDGTGDTSQISITGFPYAVVAEHAVSLSFNTGTADAEHPNAMVNTAETCYFYVSNGTAFTYTMLGNGYIRVCGTYMTT